MKRCPVCNLLNFDDALLCTSCENAFSRKEKKGYFQTIRWHMLSLALILGMMALLKFRGGEVLFLDLGRIMSSSYAGQVEIGAVRIYRDLAGNTVVEGNLLSQTDFTDLSLEVIVYNKQDIKLGQHDHPISNLSGGKSIPFLVKLPSYEELDHAHFTLRTDNAKELYLVNLVSQQE